MPAPVWLTARPIAHRGLHGAVSGAPENTLAAAAAAIEHGFAIEVDLQPAADGTAMVFHDATLDRLTPASGPLVDQPAAVLAELTIAGSDQRIPTLDDLLRLVAGRTPLVLEVKCDERVPGPFEAEIGRCLAGYEGEAAVMSFEPGAVAALARACPDRPRGLISYRYDDEAAHQTLNRLNRWARRNLLAVVTTRPDFIAYDARALPSMPAEIARRIGLPTLTWTVRSADDQRRLKQHADQIIFEGFLPAPQPGSVG